MALPDCVGLNPVQVTSQGNNIIRASQPSLRSNIAALGIVQLSGYIVPLITLPYLTRTLGAEAYGKVVFAEALMVYFILLVDYGFTWSATRAIAAHRGDRAKISQVFIATWTAQWILFAVALVIAVVLVGFTSRLRIDAWLYVAAFTAVFGSTLFPVWLLYGLEQMRVLALVQVGTRAITLLPLFLFVKHPSDLIWVPMINGMAVALAGLLALFWVHRSGFIIWTWPKWDETLAALKGGGVLFGSRAAISLYTALVPLVLGWVAGPAALANFNLADKLRGAAQALLTPLSQALYPRMSQLAVTDGAAAFHILRRSAAIVLVISGGISIGLWVVAEWLVVLVGGEDFRSAGAVLQWLSPLPLVIGMSNVFGVQILLPQGLTRPFNGILIAASIFSLCIITPMAKAFQAVGAAQTMLIAEIFVTMSMCAVVFRLGFFREHRWSKR